MLLPSRPTSLFGWKRTNWSIGRKRKRRKRRVRLKTTRDSLPRPKKRFGQNFLTDKGTARKIVELAALDASDIVVEIGPGRGAITELIVQKGCKVIALEVDRDLYSHLEVHFKEQGKLEIVNADALRFDFCTLLSDKREQLKVIANLPYNVATPILFRLLDFREHISRMVLMFQKEVANRIVASPGGKDYGALSIFPQLYAEIEPVLKLPPGAFYPVPKVNSAVLVFDMLEKPRFEVRDEKLLRRVVAAAFSQRRKKIANTLKPLLGDKEKLADVFAKADIDSTRRPETLSVEEFCRLGNAINVAESF